MRHDSGGVIRAEAHRLDPGNLGAAEALQAYIANAKSIFR